LKFAVAVSKDFAVVNCTAVVNSSKAVAVLSCQSTIKKAAAVADFTHGLLLL
jgi:hypothetical protein